MNNSYQKLKEGLVESTLNQYDFRSNYMKKSKTAQAGYILNEYLLKEYKQCNLQFDTYQTFTNLIDEYHEKCNMMFYAKEKALSSKIEFEVTQNMDVPCLFGEDETTIRFYVEAMILFTRAAMDYAAGIFSCYLFTFKIDSFNKLRKNIIKNRNNFVEIAELFESTNENEFTVISLLCGNERGKALRDQIVHKNSIKFEYCEYKENSEKEQLYIIINETYIVFEEFIDIFCLEAEIIFCFFEQYIKEKALKPICEQCQEKARCQYSNIKA